MNESIITTKISRPPIPEGVIARKVIDQLVTKLSSKSRAGIVVAPAGYGKSTLLAQFSDAFERQKGRVAWLTVDEWDNDPSRLILHIMSALQIVFPRTSSGRIEDYSSNKGSSIDSMLGHIATEMDDQDGNCVVILDDYHLIRNPSSNDVVRWLINYLPSNITFLIASREELSLSLSSLRVREELYEISASDLSFSLDEATCFLNDKKKLNLKKESIKDLLDRTEGWITGLQLAALALKDCANSSSFINDFTGSDRDVTDYLGDVVLNQLSDEMKLFLLRLSALERFSSSLASAVTGLDNSQEIIEKAEVENLFVIPMDRNRTWYRFHHLFGEFLRSRLLLLYPGENEQICRTACEWSEENGFIHDAINYSLAANDFDKSAKMISSYAKQLVQVGGGYWTLLKWTDKLPKSALDQWPEIRLSRAWSLTFLRKHKQARKELQEIDEDSQNVDIKINKERYEQIQLGIKLNRCLLSTASDNSKEAKRISSEWLRTCQGADLNDLLSVKIILAHSLLSSFEYDLSEKKLREVITLSRQFDLFYIEAWADAVLAMNQLQRADFYEVENSLRSGLRALSKLEKSSNFMSSLLPVLLAEVCYERNDLDEARDLLEGKFEFINNEPVIEAAYPGYRVLSELHAVEGDFDEAIKLINLGQESAENAGLARLEALLKAREISLLLRCGRVDRAIAETTKVRFEELKKLLITQDRRTVACEIFDLIEIEIAIAQGSGESELGRLGVMINSARQSVRKLRLMELLLLQAKIFLRLNRISDANESLFEVLDIAFQGGIHRQIISSGDDIVNAIARMDVIKIGGGDSAQALKIFASNIVSMDRLENKSKCEKNKSRQKTSSIVLPDPLTRRENQLLELIAQGNTNKQISEMLFISEQTVKWHLHQLYGKLGVRNRTSAIAKARSLSLI